MFLKVHYEFVPVSLCASLLFDLFGDAGDVGGSGEASSSNTLEKQLSHCGLMSHIREGFMFRSQ